MCTPVAQQVVQQIHTASRSLVELGLIYPYYQYNLYGKISRAFNGNSLVQRNGVTSVTGGCCLLTNLRQVRVKFHQWVTSSVWTRFNCPANSRRLCRPSHHQVAVAKVSQHTVADGVSLIARPNCLHVELYTWCCPSVGRKRFTCRLYPESKSDSFLRVCRSWTCQLLDARRKFYM